MPVYGVFKIKKQTLIKNTQRYLSSQRTLLSHKYVHYLYQNDPDKGITPETQYGLEDSEIVRLHKSNLDKASPDYQQSIRETKMQMQ
jgi:hypothetical protein